MANQPTDGEELLKGLDRVDERPAWLINAALPLPGDPAKYLAGRSLEVRAPSPQPPVTTPAPSSTQSAYGPLEPPSEGVLLAPQPRISAQGQFQSEQQQYRSPPNPRKRKALEPDIMTRIPSAPLSGYEPSAEYATETQPVELPAEQSTQGSAPKKSRTNTPWTQAEEQRLKVMREAGNSWSEIAKDMHYADFAEDESAALLAAIKEYDGNKWKVIGAKVGKPPKACEQYAREHFAGRM
ncbi:MAG: hypothetical protein Q9181_001600 [Wetmoreana brouardii]